MTRWRLYWHPISPACQAVLLTLRRLDLEQQVSLQCVDLFSNEQKSDWFIRLNPLHQVPVLVENVDDQRLVLTESRCIMTYLCAMAGGTAGSQLYPVAVRARARVDQWLYFDVSCLWHRLKRYHKPVIERRQADFDRALLAPVHQALQLLEERLANSGDGGGFLCGPGLTLADLSLVTSVYQAKALQIALDSYPAINVWCSKVEMCVNDFKSVVSGSYDYAEMFRKMGLLQ